MRRAAICLAVVMAAVPSASQAGMRMRSSADSRSFWGADEVPRVERNPRFAPVERAERVDRAERAAPRPMRSPEPSFYAREQAPARAQSVRSIRDDTTPRQQRRTSAISRKTGLAALAAIILWGGAGLTEDLRRRVAADLVDRILPKVDNNTSVGRYVNSLGDQPLRRGTTARTPRAR